MGEGNEGKFLTTLKHTTHTPTHRHTLSLRLLRQLLLSIVSTGKFLDDIHRSKVIARFEQAASLEKLLDALKLFLTQFVFLLLAFPQLCLHVPGNGLCE